MIWKNGEGYYDPTAGEAISNIIRDEKLKKRMERLGLIPAENTAAGRDRKRSVSLETCFAYIPADISGGGYPDCTALTGGCPGFGKCAFYKSMSEYKAGITKVYAAIRRKPLREQFTISKLYYSGRMPWVREADDE